MSAEQEIRELAQRHGITAQRLVIDELADTFAALSGDEVESDEVKDLLVTLAREGAIAKPKFLVLLNRYLREKYQVA